MKRRVKITKDGQEAEVMPSSLHIWEERGWTSVDDGSSETSSEVPAEEPQEEVQVVENSPWSPAKDKE